MVEVDKGEVLLKRLVELVVVGVLDELVLALQQCLELMQELLTEYNRPMAISLKVDPNIKMLCLFM